MVAPMATFGPADFIAVSDGWIDAQMLQNWRAKNEWLIPTPPNRAPSPAPYPHTIAHLLEASIVAEAGRSGIDHRTARKIIAHRAKTAAIRKSGAAWVDDISKAMLSLPEMDGGDVYWAAVLKMPERGRPPIVQGVRVVRPNDNAGEIMKDADGDVGLVIVINIGKVARKVLRYRDLMTPAS